ncbi:phosphoenolpyruvate synthase [Candidatus Gottesmanbacteria bacterium]|nr:phosphoenolpyruvate synthase [Candidatus Gottesmanbacteria bacterium]
MQKHIAWFEEIGKGDVAIVGGKGANLGEMFNAGIPVPYGFVITAFAYFDFLKSAGISKKIAGYLALLDHKDPKNLQQTSDNIRKVILKTQIPKELAKEIMIAYSNLAKRSAKKSSLSKRLASMMKNPLVAVRSSATAEDLPTASFAGQQETYLNVMGEANVLLKVREAWASLFTARAIFYRAEQKFDHFKVGIAVPVQMMVDSESSGVMFTIDPVTNEKKKLVIEAIYGLGELIVQGAVTPDHFEVDKKSLKPLSKKVVSQTIMLVRKNGVTKEYSVDKKLVGKQKITDKQLIEIARLGVKLEKHYYHPQDVEWAIEKETVYIVQTRPITTMKSESENLKTQKEEILDTSKQELLVSGDPASPGIAWGPAKVIFSASEIEKILPGDVMVTPQTNPDYVPAMKRAVAIVTEKGGRTSHAAIVSRELGIPAVVGASGASVKIKSGNVITVNGAKGEVYKGGLTQSQANILKAQVKPKSSIHLKTATKVYVNMAQPDRVVEVSKMNVNGIGLLRAEFMIADIGTHPRKLIKEHKEKVFITKLASDLSKFCEAFNPRPIVYRATDFKTNEYRNLIGGKEFEPEESNPMLGFRGAYRYISDPRVFELELEAIKMVRNKYGYKNLWLMIPFVHTVEEMAQIKKIIAASGLARSATFKLWLMVEIPSNVILIDKFCELGIDGVSIGSNDLTMLILGADRDNDEVAQVFDERNPAILWALERVIKTCSKYGVTSSICGQAPSDFPELVEKLVSWGITSISVNPDVVDVVRENIYNVEQKQGKK